MATSGESNSAGAKFGWIVVSALVAAIVGWLFLAPSERVKASAGYAQTLVASAGPFADSTVERLEEFFAEFDAALTSIQFARGARRKGNWAGGEWYFDSADAQRTRMSAAWKRLDVERHPARLCRVLGTEIANRYLGLAAFDATDLTVRLFVVRHPPGRLPAELAPYPDSNLTQLIQRRAAVRERMAVFRQRIAEASRNGEHLTEVARTGCQIKF